jgi:prolyl oligopeptidase
MEDAGDSEFAPYMREQGAYARRVLDAIPGRAAMAKRVTALSADAPTVRYVQPVHDRLFVEERPRGADNFKVYVRDSARGQARLLIDPSGCRGTTRIRRSIVAASPDARYVLWRAGHRGFQPRVA